MNRATRWLDRRVACPGPYLALVLSQAEFDRAMRDCKQPLGRPYLSTAQADATTHLLANHRGETIAVVALGDTTGRSSVEIAGLLVHEAVHVWQDHCVSIRARHCWRAMHLVAKALPTRHFSLIERELPPPHQRDRQRSHVKKKNHLATIPYEAREPA